MPKARTSPLSCLFAINKPSGQVSMQLLNKLQPLFASSSLFAETGAAASNAGGGKQKGRYGGKRNRGRDNRIKMGQGGTLDPLADGVLVIGTHNATKHLAKFLDSTKEYRAIGLLGCSTDSYDSDGKRVKMTSSDHVTAEAIRNVLPQFRGEIMQVPPAFSALKMDGKPLYEYAREGVPLPRPIEARKQTVHALELVALTPGDRHTYEYPQQALDDQARDEFEKLERMVKNGKTELPDKPESSAAGDQSASAANVDATAATTSTAEPASRSDSATPAHPTTARPPIFELTMTVSSGTYVRSLVHDIALAVGSSAHVVKLTRTRQGEFSLGNGLVEADAAASDATEGPAADPNTVGEAPSADEDSEKVPPFTGRCIEWTVFERALEQFDVRKRKSGDDAAPETTELAEWEQEILSKCKEV